MEKFELTVLGCGSAKPTTRHFPSSQVLNVRDKFFMIDCGEGTQLQYCRNKLPFNRLNHLLLICLGALQSCMFIVPKDWNRC